MGTIPSLTQCHQNLCWQIDHHDTFTVSHDQDQPDGYTQVHQCVRHQHVANKDFIIVAISMHDEIDQVELLRIRLKMIRF